MVDLMESEALGTALMHFHRTGKPTAMLCHGPIAFVATVKDPTAFRKAVVAGGATAAKAMTAGWAYAGYKMTLLSNVEEVSKEQALGGRMPFYIEDVVRDAGAVISVGPPAQPYVVVDREVITGQNPASDEQLTDAVLAALQNKSR
jgi:putative intracellular protease/amidase